MIPPINWARKPKWQQEMFKHFGEACAFTGRTENITIDHLIPREQAYGDVEARTNLLPICHRINASKGDSHLFDWYEANGERLGIPNEKFTAAITYVADKLGMTLQEYKDYYDQRYYRETRTENYMKIQGDSESMGVVDYRKSKFVMVPRVLVEDSTLTQRDRVTYMALCLYTNNDTKQSHPSAETLAKVICSSRSSVFRSLKTLESRGYIKRVNRFLGTKKQTTNAYILLDVG